MTPYNYAASVGRALDAGATHLLDPGSGGTVTVAPKGVAILVIETAGARTLQAAAGVDLGTSVKCYATVAAASVNGVTLEDGGFAEFQVTLTAAGANEWTLTSLIPATTQAAITGDISLYNETTLKALLTALAALGLITDSTTT